MPWDLFLAVLLQENYKKKATTNNKKQPKTSFSLYDIFSLKIYT